MKTYNWEGVNPDGYFLDKLEQYHQLYRLSRNCSKYRQQLYQYHRSEERFSRNAETDLVCRLLLEKKKRRLDCLRTITVRLRCKLSSVVTAQVIRFRYLMLSTDT